MKSERVWLQIPALVLTLTVAVPTIARAQFSFDDLPCASYPQVGDPVLSSDSGSAAADSTFGYGYGSFGSMGYGYGAGSGSMGVGYGSFTGMGMFPTNRFGPNIDPLPRMTAGDPFQPAFEAGRKSQGRITQSPRIQPGRSRTRKPREIRRTPDTKGDAQSRNRKVS